MSWDAGQRAVAAPIGATVSGTAAAARAQIHIDIMFRVVEWSWEEMGPVTVATLFSRTLVTLLEKEGLVEFAVEA